MRMDMLATCRIPCPLRTASEQEDKITITNSKSERNNVNLKKGNDKIQRNKQVRLGRKKTVKCDNSNKISEKNGLSRINAKKKSK